jgi:hypothetical protein
MNGQIDEAAYYNLVKFLHKLNVVSQASYAEHWLKIMKYAYTGEAS